MGFNNSNIKGNWDDAFKYIIRAAIHFVTGITKLVVGLGAALLNITTFVQNVMIDIIKVLAQAFIFFANQGQKVFYWLGEQIVKALSEPLQAVIDMINGIIIALSGVEGFGWVRRLMLPDVSAIANGFKSAREELDSTSDAVDNLFNKFKLDYISADDIGNLQNELDTTANILLDKTGQTSSETKVINNNINVEASGTATNLVDEIASKILNTLQEVQ